MSKYKQIDVIEDIENEVREETCVISSDLKVKAEPVNKPLVEQDDKIPPHTEFSIKSKEFESTDSDRKSEPVETIEADKNDRKTNVKVELVNKPLVEQDENNIHMLLATNDFAPKVSKSKLRKLRRKLAKKAKKRNERDSNGNTV